MTGPPGIGVTTETMALVPHHPQHAHAQVSYVYELLLNVLEKHDNDMADRPLETHNMTVLSM